MKYIYFKLGYDISSNWHRESGFSKYDISNSRFNIEIKSTIGEYPIVKIKHTQIFNDDKVYLVAICAQDNDDGQSVLELIDELRDIPESFNSISFHINIEHELRRVSLIAAKEKKFKLLQALMYDTDQIVPFNEIPYAISDIQYNYDLSNQKSIDIANNTAIFDNFIC